jgi:competence protein ComEC
MDEREIDAGGRSSPPASAPARGWQNPIAEFRAAGRLWIAAAFEREMDRGRGFLWLPVAFGVGVLVYFTLPREPSFLALTICLLVLATLSVRSRATGRWYRTLVILTAIFAGAVDAKVRTDLAVAPVVPRDMTTTVTGWIAAAEESPRGGKRILVRVANIADIRPVEMPLNVRITVRSQADTLHIGDAISVLARLSPPSGPVIPGGYDFAFAPFFQRIGGSGFAYGAGRRADLGPPPIGIRLGQPLGVFRDLLRVRIEEALPGDYGHIAAALVMGDQRGIAQSTQDSMRASGLGHILSISGLHLALVAGSVFWLIRALLALSPTLALRFPIKKWAAGAALAVATFYVGISGAEVATMRSWVMLAIMLVAIMIDRRALTLRNVALAALVILVFSPESLLSISFQMSFAATVALIAAYEFLSKLPRRDLGLADRRERSLLDRVRAAITTLFVTSLIAGLATAPFAAFYFQRVAPLTILANMAVAPAVGFVVMPMVLLAVVAMPFGLEALPLAVMQWGLQWMLAVSDKVATWSAGFGGIAAPPASVLLLMVAGFLWLALWQERWRIAGLAPILVALPIAFTAVRPDILIDEDGTAVAVRASDGLLRMMVGKGAAFEVQMWLRADADVRPANAPGLKAGVACDPIGCVAHASNDAVVALTMRRVGFAEDCELAAVVVSALRAPPSCGTSAIVIDRERLDQFGAHALFLRSNGTFWIETAYPRVRRPFMPPLRTG